MTKSNYVIKWYEFIVMGVISLVLSLIFLFNGFSRLIGDRDYSEMSSSKTSGLAYMVSKFEQTNWKYLLILIFALLTYLNFKRGYKLYKTKINK